MITIFTLGHSNHPLPRFIDLLRQHQIEIVVDVRSTPYSRHAPLPYFMGAAGFESDQDADEVPWQHALLDHLRFDLESMRGPS